MPAPGSRPASAAACCSASASRSMPNSVATPSGSSRVTWAAARSASAAVCCSVPGQPKTANERPESPPSPALMACHRLPCSRVGDELLGAGC